jgi:hypothetical protein
MLSGDRGRELAADAANRGGAAIHGPQRERGLWSFLTWSFFLSQLAAGNAFAAGAAQAGSATDLKSPDGTADAGKIGAALLGTPDARPLGDLEAQSATASTAAAPLQNTSAPGDTKLGGIEQLDTTSDAGIALEAAAIQSTTGSEAMLADAAPPASASESDSTIAPDTLSIVLPDIELPQIVELPPVLETVGDVADGLGETLESLLTPVAETVEDLASVLEPTLDNLLAPVADLTAVLGPTLDGLEPTVETVEDLAAVLWPTLDLALAPVEALTDGLADALETALDPLLAPVANLTEDVGNLIEPIGGIAGEIIQLADPVIDIVEPFLDPVMNVVEDAQPVLDPVLVVAAPVVDLLEPTIEPLLQPLAPVAAPVLDLLPLSMGNDGFLGDLFGINEPTDAVGSTGTLEFAVDVDASPYDLIETGAYTEFGIELNLNPIGNEGGTGDLVEHIAESVSSLVDDSDDAGNALPSLLGSLQHDLGLRGLGEGLI